MISLGYWELLSNGRSPGQPAKTLVLHGFILTCVESRVCAYALFIFWDQVTIEEGNFFVLFDDNLFKYMLK